MPLAKIQKLTWKFSKGGSYGGTELSWFSTMLRTFRGFLEYFPENYPLPSLLCLSPFGIFFAECKNQTIFSEKFHKLAF